MRSYSFKASEWKEWTDCNLPEARDSFGLAVHQNEIYMFGGSSYETQFGDLHAFNTLTCSWRRIDSAVTPSPRNPLVFADIDGEAILLYGGISLSSGTICNDAFFFRGGKWVVAERIINAPNNLVGSKFAVCGSQVYLFGGEHADMDGTLVPNTSVYRMEANLDELTLEFVEENSQGKSPCARTGHAMAAIGRDYVMVVGGQSIRENKMLRDIWLYDVDCGDWSRIDPANGPLRPLADNTLLLHGSCLLILGGLTEHYNMWNEQILAL